MTIYTFIHLFFFVINISALQDAEEMDNERTMMVERYRKEITSLKEIHITECETINEELEKKEDFYKNEILELKESVRDLQQIKEEYQNQENLIIENFDMEILKQNEKYLEKEKVRKSHNFIEMIIFEFIFSFVALVVSS